MYSFLFYYYLQSAAAPSPALGQMPPNDGMPGGPMPPGFFQVTMTTNHLTIVSSQSTQFNMPYMPSVLEVFSFG